MINFEGDEWHVAVARNLEEEKKLIEVASNLLDIAKKTEWLYIGRESRISQGAGSLAG